MSNVPEGNFFCAPEEIIDVVLVLYLRGDGGFRGYRFSTGVTWWLTAEYSSRYGNILVSSGTFVPRVV